MSTETSSLIIPCHWDKDTIKQIAQQNNDASRNIQVREVYGVLADGGPLGHGRSRTSVVSVSPAGSDRP